MTDRYQELLDFLKKQYIPCSACNPCDCGNSCAQSLIPLNGDASFRRYYRLKLNRRDFENLCITNHADPVLWQEDGAFSYPGSIIIMDAPPETQKNREFAAINHILKHAKMLVPTILCADMERGFMVLEDLGSTLFADAAVGTERRAFYSKAVEVLCHIGSMPLNTNQAALMHDRRASADDSVRPLIGRYEMDSSDYRYLSHTLPRFDEDFIRMELGICSEWLFDRTLHLTIEPYEQEILDKTWDFLVKECLRQPQVAMHRDFHCRNLMIVPDRCHSAADAHIAVIDYQDMVLGPVGYDVASLLYDCYTVLTKEERQELLQLSYDIYTASGLFDAARISLEDYHRMVVACALQRHIKVLGLFNRLNLRDGKNGYLKDLPLVLDYVLTNSQEFPELSAFSRFLEQKVKGHI